MSRLTLLLLIIIPLATLPGCQTNPNRSPSETIVGGTAAGTGAGALIGWAAGKPGTGAAVGAAFGFLASAIQADADSREKKRIDEERRSTRVTYVERRAPVREEYRSERDERRDRAYNYLYDAQRTTDRVRAESLLKKSLTEYRTPEAHTALGELYEAQRDWAGAESEYRRALDLDPGYRPADDNLQRLQRR